MLLSDLESGEFEHKSGVSGQTIVDMLSFQVADFAFKGLGKLIHGSVEVCLIAGKLAQK